MQLHQLRPRHKLKKRKRVGRGGKRGTYSGKGQKGQRSRAGRKLKPAIRELIKRYPKLRGYRFQKIIKNQVTLNLENLEKKFRSSETVNPKLLIERKLIRRMKGKVPQIKILGKGKLTKKLTIEGCEVSKQVEEKINKAGGSVKKIKP